MKRLSAVPVTEEQALAIARKGLWGDADFKNRTLKEWSAYARARYAAPEPWFRRLRALPAALALVLVLAAAFVASPEEPGGLSRPGSTGGIDP